MLLVDYGNNVYFGLMIILVGNFCEAIRSK
jgi:hypothetical protein